MERGPDSTEYSKFNAQLRKLSPTTAGRLSRRSNSESVLDVQSWAFDVPVKKNPIFPRNLAPDFQQYTGEQAQPRQQQSVEGPI